MSVGDRFRGHCGQPDETYFIEPVHEYGETDRRKYGTGCMQYCEKRRRTSSPVSKNSVI